MTTYNGEAYLKKQIDSVVDQLLENDELIVFDDCSTDGTWEILKRYHDSRVRRYRNTKNVGYIQNFENCFHQASNRVILICDQDDIWYFNKLSTVRKMYSENQDLILMISNMDLIDSNDALIKSEALSHFKRGRNKLVNTMQGFVRGRYYGCTMAIDRMMLLSALPLPRNHPSYDLYLGLICELRGRVQALSNSLIAHRLHEKNQSLQKRGRLDKVLIRRFLMAVNILKHTWR
jgi:glycosyltransferase involved in cell wall biosynthesis